MTRSSIAPRGPSAAPVLLLFALLSSAPSPGTLLEEIRVRSSEELLAAARAARAGAVIVLAPGEYAPDVRIEGLRGSERRPIVIRGADPDDPPVFEGGGQALHLVDCSFVTLKDIVVRGSSHNGINIDDGGSVETPARGISVEGVTFEDIGPRGNRDGLKLSGLDGFVVRGCRFSGWGGSAIDMVGSHRGVIDECSFEGKEGFSQSNAVQIKGGSSRVSVRRSFFRNAGHRGVNLGGSTGEPYFRPPDARFEAEDVEVVGCRFTGGMAAVAFVNARGGRVVSNTIHLPEKWVARILQESTGERFPSCREGRFERNLILYDARMTVPVNVGPGTAPETFRFRENAWFRIDAEGPPGEVSRPRLPVAEEGGVYQVDPEIEGAGTAEMRATSKDPRLRKIGARGYRPKGK